MAYVVFAREPAIFFLGGGQYCPLGPNKVTVVLQKLTFFQIPQIIINWLNLEFQSAYLFAIRFL